MTVSGGAGTCREKTAATVVAPVYCRNRLIPSGALCGDGARQQVFALSGERSAGRRRRQRLLRSTARCALRTDCPHG